MGGGGVIAGAPLEVEYDGLSAEELLARSGSVIEERYGSVLVVPDVHHDILRRRRQEKAEHSPVFAWEIWRSR